MASVPTHVTMRNGASRGALIDFVRPYDQQIKFVLDQLDGDKLWAWCLWRAPEGTDLRMDLPDSDNYMQCAGTAQKMTIEVRTVDSDGTVNQYTVGRTPPEGWSQKTEEPSEIIHWDRGRRSLRIYPHEVFDSEEAAAIFFDYFQTDGLSAPYVIREF